jgi:hypothetical protein
MQSCPIAVTHATLAALAGALLAAPVAAQPEQATRPATGRSTDWFVDAGFGVFVHYLSGIQNNPDEIHSLGRETSWDECVREFDTERFADTMKEVGAGYVIFTVMQINRTMIAPNATFDRITGYAPGEACATRDLIADLADALGRRGIRLMLYYTGDGPRADEKAGPAMGWTGGDVTDEFVDNWSSVAREYSERYGDRVAGWWVDGCYPWIGYDDAKLRRFGDALRAGNPDSLVAFNRGVDPKVMSYVGGEDYTCGEQNSFFDMPAGRFLDGEQWHILSYLGPWWGGAGSKYAKRELGEYVFDVHQRGGAVSIDVLLYRDGSLDRSQVEMLKAVRHELATGKDRPPVPPGNLAYRKQAKLLSLDGSHELVVNSGTQFPRLGVDGRLDTYALAGGEWAWTFAVDLIDTQPVSRIKVTFATGFPTELELRVSPDGQTWTTVAHETGLDGSPFEATFDPVVARYVRVCSIKPDGPEQTGSQMSVAELEVYE